VNQPEALVKVLDTLEQARTDFNASLSGGKQVSLADTIVLGGAAAIEAAAQRGGVTVTVPFAPGRVDATDAQTDVDSFAVLEPVFDAFRNYVQGAPVRPVEELLLERAALLTLSAPEMTVLLGGLRTLGTNLGDSPLGVLTDRPGTLSNDFFVNLLDNNLSWTKSSRCEHFYEGTVAGQDGVKWTGSAADLVFGSNSQLRALAEVYAGSDMSETFVHDFVPRRAAPQGAAFLWSGRERLLRGSNNATVFEPPRRQERQGKIKTQAWGSSRCEIKSSVA